METFEQQIFPLFEDGLQSFPQGCPASRPPLPGSEEVREMTVGSGRQCSMLLSELSPLGAFSRILLESSHWTSSEEYCYVWERLDTRFGCSAFQLTQLGQGTGGNGCSLWRPIEAQVMDSKDWPVMRLWRTPDASMASGGAANGEDRLAQGHVMGLHDQAKTPKLWPTPKSTDANGTGGIHLQGGQDLRTVVERPKLWPTPTQIDGASGGRSVDYIKEKGTNSNLRNAAKLWPTPTVPNGGRRNPEGTSITGKKPDGGKAQIDLREYAIRMWLTPTSRDHKDGECGNGRTDILGQAVNPSPQTGSLNPVFVEWLMMFPLGWTESISG